MYVYASLINRVFLCGCCFGTFFLSQSPPSWEYETFALCAICVVPRAWCARCAGCGASVPNAGPVLTDEVSPNASNGSAPYPSAARRYLIFCSALKPTADGGSGLTRMLLEAVCGKMLRTRADLREFRFGIWKIFLGSKNCHAHIRFSSLEMVCMVLLSYVQLPAVGFHPGAVESLFVCSLFVFLTKIAGFLFGVRLVVETAWS